MTNKSLGQVHEYILSLYTDNQEDKITSVASNYKSLLKNHPILQLMVNFISDIENNTFTDSSYAKELISEYMSFFSEIDKKEYEQAISALGSFINSTVENVSQSSVPNYILCVEDLAKMVITGNKNPSRKIECMRIITDKLAENKDNEKPISFTEVEKKKLFDKVENLTELQKEAYVAITFLEENKKVEYRNKLIEECKELIIDYYRKGILNEDTRNSFIKLENELNEKYNVDKTTNEEIINIVELVETLKEENV